MAYTMIVANLLRRDGRKPSIRFEEIQSCPPSPDYQANAPVALYKLYNNFNTGLTSNNCPALRNGAHKAVSKGYKSAAILARLLSWCPPTSPCYTGGGGALSVVVRDSIIVANETFSSAHETDANTRNLFFATEFYFANAQCNGQQGFKSTQYLQTSSPTFKFDDDIFKDADARTFDSIDIISGVCTFNQDILNTSICSPCSGKFDPEKLRQARPTFHEMEYISRSSAAIADIVGMLILRFGGQGVRVPVSIGLDIPSFHYYHTAITALDKGVCTPEEALRWVEAVDLRHDQIARVFTSAVRHQLRQRGVDLAGYEVRISAKATPMASSLKAALQEGRKPSLDDVLQELDREDAGGWRRFYQLIPNKERPKSFEDLAYLFYVFFILKLALAGDPAAECPYQRMPALADGETATFTPIGKSKPRRLIVSIDDPAERRIYSRSQEMMKKLRQSSENPTDSALVEVYMCRRVLVNGNQTRARLFHHDPIPEIPSLSCLSDCGSCQGQLVEPLDVVSQLYGFDCASHLQSWFAEVGLQA